MRANLSMSQFLLFAGLGGIGTLVHYVVLVICVQALATDAVAASLFGYASGAITNFFLSQHVAFRSKANPLETAPRFLAVALTGFSLNWFVMWSLVDQLGVQYLLAQIISTSSIVGFNYVANAIWTFGGERRGR
jgi:putative flippase GtrA